MTSFAVIIPSYNRQDLIRATLDSIFAQTPPVGGGAWQLEVIVVDDGSKDDSVGIIRREYAGRVTLLTQANKGPGAARHTGSMASTAEYICFLDSDDVWFPWTLRRYAEAIEKFGRPSFIAGKPLRFSSEAQLAQAADGPLDADSYDDFLTTYRDWLWWGASSFVIRGDAYRRVGGMTLEFVGGEDADMTLRLGVEPGFVHVKGPYTFGYREAATGTQMTHVATIHKGMKLLVDDEKAGKYPGGPGRRRERREIITRHARWGSFLCLRGGDLARAWGLYRDTFAWHLGMGRMKYLAGFPLVYARTALSRPEKKSHA
jgi:glycosyltransferase involved in cell wall biosynthesis